MKAFVCTEWGAPTVLRYEALPVQALGAGQIRIDVHAADIGFQDVLMVAGKYQLKPAFPFAPGNVAAGVVSACADDVVDHKVGDRVVAVMPYGGYAEEAVVSAASAVNVPPGVTFAEAAVLGMTYATAFQGLVDRARIEPAETLLVRGAGSGVGLAAVELGRAFGATVIAAASSSEKLDIAAAAGARHLIDTSAGSVRDRVMEITGGQGANVIFDTVGNDFKDVCLRSIARRGRILIVGFAGGEIPMIPANYVLIKLCAVLGVGWGHSVFDKEPAHYRDVLTRVLRLRADGLIATPALKPHRPEGLIAAMQSLESRSVSGRNVLVFKDSG